jgi:hypothetical protein
MNHSERVRECLELKKTNQKRCSKCKLIKNLASFYWNEKQGYRRSRCQDCGILKKRRFIGENKKLVKLGCKRCSECETIKPLEEFNGIKKKSYCKPCDSILHKRRTYKLEPLDIQKMFENQNGQCKICKIQLTKNNQAIDHCHKTKIVRGLLCFKCNSALGLLNDDIEIIQSLLEYLIQNAG